MLQLCGDMWNPNVYCNMGWARGTYLLPQFYDVSRIYSTIRASRGINELNKFKNCAGNFVFAIRSAFNVLNTSDARD